MGDEENEELLTGQEPLLLKHLFEMVFKKRKFVNWYNSLTKRPSSPMFLKWLLMQDVLRIMEPAHPGKLYAALRRTTNKETGLKNGLTDVFYDDFREHFLVKPKEEHVKYLNKQYDHLQTKLNDDEKRTEVFQGLQAKAAAKESYLELMAQKAPWLAPSGEETLELVAAEDVCRLLTVAVIVSLNYKTNTGRKITEDDLDKLCIEFLYHKPEELPEFSLKEIFDTLLQGRRWGAVPVDSPEKFIPKEMDRVSKMDCLRILLSGIPRYYTLIPLDGEPESTDKTYADETQILQNDATQDEIRNLAGFYEQYKGRQNLDNLWRSMSAALRENLCAFDQFYRSVFADEGDESVKKEALEAVRRGRFNDSEKIKKNFANMLSNCDWVETICSAFWSGHDVKETLIKADVFDCITAFVLIAVCCLKTKPGGADDSIPQKRERFKNALIQKIKEVFFADYDTAIHTIGEGYKQAKDLDWSQAPPEKRAELAQLLKNCCELCKMAGMDLSQLFQKILAEPENLLTAYAPSMINANTKVEESDRDKSKPRLLVDDPNSPKGGK